MIPRVLTNFVSAGVLDPNRSQLATQQALCQNPPLPTEEWVCIKDYYSDEEQSDTVEAVRTDREVQFSPATSRSVCLALPSIDTVAESVSSMLEMTASPLSAVSFVPLTATSTAPESGAHHQAPSTNPLAAAVSPAQGSSFLATQLVDSGGITTQPASSAAPQVR